MTRVVELNDGALRVADASGVLAASPGYAVVSAQRLIIGDAARREARLDPRHTTNAFWQRLSMDPVQHPHPSARTLADLAHAHLEQVWAEAGDASADGDDEVVFAVPGHYGREQLALLLGIARECPFTPVGLVDVGVAAAADAEPDGPDAVHVGTLLQQTVLTHVSGDGGWERRQVVDLPALGLAGLRDAWVQQIADAFIRETRFDPLHDARVEQRLYDALDGWIARLATAEEISAEVEAGAHVYRVDLVRDALVQKVAPRYRALVEALAGLGGADTRVLLSSALAGLPGLTDQVRAAGREVVVLDDAATVRGALAREQEIRHDGEALRFVTRLERRGGGRGAGPSAAASQPEPAPAAKREADPEPTSDREAPAPATVPAPPPAATAPSAVVTHVLLDDTAWALTGDVVRIGGGGLGGEALPDALGTLRRDGATWILEPEGRGHPGPLEPGESRLLGPERVVLTLIRVVDRARSDTTAGDA